MKLLVCIALLFICIPLYATTIIPVSGEIAAGSIAYTSYGSAVDNVIDGVVNVNSWLAVFLDPTPVINFKLGGNFDLTQLNFYNNGGGAGADTEDIGSFTLNFYNASGQSVGTFSTNPALGESKQVFAINATNVENVDMIITAGTGRGYVIFHEINFEGLESVSSVPEPSTILLTLLTSIALFFQRIKKNLL